MAETGGACGPPPAVPAYGRASLADLLPAVLASLGLRGEADVLDLPPTARAVVLLVDGLGAELLRRHADEAPFLSSLPSRDLTAGFPATTVASLASLGTGLPPGQHGLTGYTSWVQEVAQTVGWLAWSPAAGGGDLREHLVPEQVQPRPTVFERAALAGVAVTVAAPAHFAGSGLTRAVLRGGSYRGAVTPGDAVATAVTASRTGSRSLVYCYTADLDLVGHVRGVDSEAWRSQLRLVDRFAEELATRLPAGTALHVTADHGMVDVEPGARVDVDASPVLRDGMSALAGEPRARHVHAVPGAAADLLARWRAELGDRMWIGSRADAVAAGLFGPVVDPPALRRIGDVVAIATSGVAVVRTQHEPMLSSLRGQHGALTDQELLVPLLSG
ncbi:MAG: nucleotide pyrophosphatase/phosphodiesterase family protein [Mycobacteriales bacterium]